MGKEKQKPRERALGDHLQVIVTVNKPKVSLGQGERGVLILVPSFVLSEKGNHFWFHSQADVFKLLSEALACAKHGLMALHPPPPPKGCSLYAVHVS